MTRSHDRRATTYCPAVDGGGPSRTLQPPPRRWRRKSKGGRAAGPGAVYHGVFLLKVVYYETRAWGAAWGAHSGGLQTIGNSLKLSLGACIVLWAEQKRARAPPGVSSTRTLKILSHKKKLKPPRNQSCSRTCPPIGPPTKLSGRPGEKSHATFDWVFTSQRRQILPPSDTIHHRGKKVALAQKIF